MTVEGRENIPAGPCVFVGNHRSYYDIPILLTALDAPHGILAKEELEKIPLLNRWMKLLGCVFVKRDDIRASVKALNDATAIVESGRSFVIFPEGTRYKGEEAARASSKPVPSALPSRRGCPWCRWPSPVRGACLRPRPAGHARRYPGAHPARHPDRRHEQGRTEAACPMPCARPFWPNCKENYGKLSLRAGDRPRRPYPAAEKQYTRKERWANWWDYNLKWALLIGIAAAFVAYSFIGQYFFTTKPDYNVAVVAPCYLPDDTVTALQEQLARYGEDLNGDGKTVVTLNVYTLDYSAGDTQTESDAYLTMAGTTKLATDVQAA